MNKRNLTVPVMILIMCCLLSSALVGICGAYFLAESQYRILSGLVQEIIGQYPEDEQKIISLIKEKSYPSGDETGADRDYLAIYGYRADDFASEYKGKMILLAGFAAAVFLVLFLCLLIMIRKRCQGKISDLTQYLEKINMGKDVTILPLEEDDFSQLQDEIYKTVTNLYQTKDTALMAKTNYADNLANIAHQIKTPLTSVAIMTQLLKNEWKEEYVEQIQKQTGRLTQLAEALLTLSCIDAGVLKLEKSKIDVYTMLQLSVEAMSDITEKKEIMVSLPNHSEIQFLGDMEWSVEALINLIKNCMEHTEEGGTVSIDYSQNPLYTEIIIRDGGKGFAEKDLRHIFERFYRGEGASGTGIGIGLSLAKSIIEMQNGCIEAKNLPEGGACFAVRFYSH